MEPQPRAARIAALNGGAALRRAGIALVAGLAWSAGSLGAAELPEGPRLLILSSPDVSIVEKVVEAVTTGRPTVKVEQVVIKSGDRITDTVRRLGPTLQHYRAAFVTSIGIARELQKENDRIPIVFIGEADPVQLCVADSMQRPGRNATGYMDYLPDDDTKMMEALVQGFPHLRTIYMMVADSSYWVPECGPIGRPDKPPKPLCVPGPRRFEQNLGWWQQTPETLQQARRLGVEVRFVMLCHPEDFKLLTTLAPGRHDVGFVFAYQGLYINNREKLIKQVALSRRPAIFGRRFFAECGGLMSLEPILDANDNEMAITMLMRVLDGRPPATLPIQQPRGFRLSVNVAAAAAQGLRPSMSLLQRANDVILTLKAGR